LQLSSWVLSWLRFSSCYPSNFDLDYSCGAFEQSAAHAGLPSLYSVKDIQCQEKNCEWRVSVNVLAEKLDAKILEGKFFCDRKMGRALLESECRMG
jgi:hypothetical protein